jgi:rare lipoprotein A
MIKEDVNQIINDTQKSDEVLEDSTIYVKKVGIHSATWYNPHGARTASGLRFHKDSLTCAYNFTKMHSLLKVTNFNTNEFIIVKVIDRMGNKSSNHIDLSKCAFDSIGDPKSGRIKVIVEEVINN